MYRNIDIYPFYINWLKGPCELLPPLGFRRLSSDSRSWNVFLFACFFFCNVFIFSDTACLILNIYETFLNYVENIVYIISSSQNDLTKTLSYIYIVM